MLTVSNALHRSMETTPVTKPLSIFESHLSVIWIRDITVELSVLNPDDDNDDDNDNDNDDNDYDDDELYLRRVNLFS